MGQGVAGEEARVGFSRLGSRGGSSAVSPALVGTLADVSVPEVELEVSPTAPLPIGAGAAGAVGRDFHGSLAGAGATSRYHQAHGGGDEDDRDRSRARPARGLDAWSAGEQARTREIGSRRRAIARDRKNGRDFRI